MPTYTIRDPQTGRSVKLTGDSPPTESELTEIFAKLGPAPDLHVNGKPEGGMLSTAADVGIGALKGAAGTAVGFGKAVQAIPGVTRAVDALYGQPGLSKQAFSEADAALVSTNTAQSVGKGLETAAEIALPLVKGARMAAAVVPTRAKAGQQFQQVMSKVGDTAVDMARPGDAALRIQQLSERGASMPKVVRDLLKRATDPAQGDITYREARDFYSNISRLSADEFQRLNPVVKMEVGKLRVALDRALAATAKAGGQEDTYRAAMKQYRVASRINELSKTALKYGAGLVGAGAAVKLASEVTGR